MKSAKTLTFALCVIAAIIGFIALLFVGEGHYVTDERYSVAIRVFMATERAKSSSLPVFLAGFMQVFGLFVLAFLELMMVIG